MIDKNEHHESQHQQLCENATTKLAWIKPELISMNRSATESGSTLPVEPFENTAYPFFSPS